MTDRREFSIAVALAITHRATDSSGRIHCEKCGIWVKSRRDYEIDHVLSEGMRSAADKKRKLTPADGQLLCLAICHKSKTRVDKGDQAEAKRREAANLGIKPPGKAEIQRPTREPKKPLRTALGPPGLARRGFRPAGGMK
jgi:hypothetical protein